MIERLEQRQLMSVTLTGTSGNNVFELQQQADGHIWVWFQRPNTQSPNLKIAAGTPILVDGGGGYDFLLIDNLITAPITADMTGEIDLADSGQDLTINSGNVVINITDQTPAAPRIPLRGTAALAPRHNWGAGFLKHLLDH